jgi:hypothetical protein
MLRDMEASESPEARAMAQTLRQNQATRARIEAEYRAAGNWNGLLGLAGSENRAAVLVEALEATPGKEGKTELLRDWFSSCDALLPQREQLRAHLEQTTFFTDEEGAALMPDFFQTSIVYRGAWHDDEVDRALSWTQDRAFAERFARGLTGFRARLVLGMYREDATPTIFRGYAEEAYAFFNGRGEREVVAKRVVGIEPIAELVSADG